jgi:hypothetical protein
MKTAQKHLVPVIIRVRARHSENYADLDSLTTIVGPQGIAVFEFSFKDNLNGDESSFKVGCRLVKTMANFKCACSVVWARSVEDLLQAVYAQFGELGKWKFIGGEFTQEIENADCVGSWADR